MMSIELAATLLVFAGVVQIGVLVALSCFLVKSLTRIEFSIEFGEWMEQANKKRREQDDAEIH